MHHAPSVSLPVGRSLWAFRLALLAWLAGCGALLLWWSSAEPSGGRLAALLAAQLIAGGIAWHAWHTAPRGLLRWDGSLWHWEAAAGQAHGQPCTLREPAVVLDFQSLVLVGTRAADGAPARAVPSQLWLERSSAGPGPAGDACWQALRRAVYSRAAFPGPPSRPNGAAAPP
jgi:toxin CptA